jgi:predicted HicB family RNase H-like nuclease
MSYLDTIPLKQTSPFLNANQEALNNTESTISQKASKTVKTSIIKPIKEKNKAFTTYLPVKLIDEIKLIAKQNNVSINEVVKQALEMIKA